MNGETMDNLSNAVVKGDEANILELSKAAIAKGIIAEDILEKGLIPGIRKVGELFTKGEYFLPELIISGKAMQVAVEYLIPKFSGGKSAVSGRFLIGTVKGDVHDLGKNIVKMMLKSNGWEVTDLGVDVSPEQFTAALKEGNFDICGMSVLLTMTMPQASETIKAIKNAGLRERVKIMVGGAPVTQEYAQKIGADAYGRDAWDTITKAEGLLKEKK